MRTEITFATGNKGKVESLRRSLERCGVTNVTIIQEPLELIEPQAESAEEVALAKARQAYQLLGRSVLVDDSSFHINALGGFPGPYIKYMLTTIGIDGILKIMEGREDRSAYFLSFLVFIDEEGNEHAISGAPLHGTITAEADTFDNETAWSDLYKIFMPNGSSKVLARMSHEEHAAMKRDGDSPYGAFASWLKEQ